MSSWAFTIGWCYYSPVYFITRIPVCFVKMVSVDTPCAITSIPSSFSSLRSTHPPDSGLFYASRLAVMWGVSRARILSSHYALLNLVFVPHIILSGITTLFSHLSCVTLQRVRKLDSSLHETYDRSNETPSKNYPTAFESLIPLLCIAKKAR
jgi:hypothetical protein